MSHRDKGTEFHICEVSFLRASVRERSVVANGRVLLTFEAEGV